MNIKNTIKKMSAIGAGALFLGATVMGAVAYDLSDYPHPFVKDGAFDGKIVVGTSGSAAGIAADYLGVVDIATSLQVAAKSAASTSGEVGGVVIGGEDVLVNIGSSASTAKYDYKDLEGFKNEEVDVDGTDYEYTEQLVIGASGVSIDSSTTTNYPEDRSYDDTAYMEFADGGVFYNISFDDPIAYGAVDEATNDELKIDMLGKELKITDILSSKLTVESSNEFFLTEGQEIEVDERTVTVERVGSGSVIVNVDGTSKVVSEGSQEKFDGFEVEVDSIFFIEGATDNGANLKMGDSISETFTDGDALKIFDGVTKNSEATWIWNIETNGTHLMAFGAELNQNFYRLGADKDTERDAIMIGEQLNLPNNYAAVEFSGWDKSAMATTSDVNIAFEQHDFDSADGSPVTYGTHWYLTLSSDETDAFIIDDGSSTKKADILYLTTKKTSMDEWHVFYDDGEDEIYAGQYDGSDLTDLAIKLDDDLVDLEFYNSTFDAGADPDAGAGQYRFTLGFPAPGTDLLNFSVTVAADGIKYFGAAEGDADAADFSYYTSEQTINGVDDRIRKTIYGATWTDVEGAMNSDDFDITIPHDGQVAKVVFKSFDTTVGGSSGDAYMVNPIGVGLAITDVDGEQLLGDENLIVVGGPYVNSVAKELMGNPTGDQINAMFEPGKAKIKLYEDENAILVAGYLSKDTVGASRVLAEYFNPDYALTGSEVEISVPSLDQLSVGTPTLPSHTDEIEVVEPAE